MSQDDVLYCNTPRGAALLDSADVKGHFWPLCRCYISENFLTYCGIASSVMALNSLGVDAPADPQIHPYRMFTQENVFTEAVLEHRRPLDVEKGGNTLEQLATLLRALGVGVDVYFADALEEDDTRRLLVDALSAPDQRVLVDFDRQRLHQKGHGHFSPLAAWHAAEDRFLLLDVARYKLPPCWVKASVLHEAMRGTDSTSEKSRGFLVVTHRADSSAS